LLTFVVTYFVSVRYISELPYRTFIRDNLSVKKMPASLQVRSASLR